MQNLRDVMARLGPAALAWHDNASAWKAKNQPQHSVQLKGSTLELSMLDFIGEDFWTGEGITDRWVAKELKAAKDVRFIHILLNSPGGDYFAGVAIHNLLKMHPAKVTVEVIGQAASAASVIALGADELVMHSGTMLMVHEAWTYAGGPAGALENAAAMLRKVNTEAVDIYTKRTGMARAEVEALVEATTWIGSAEAVEKGWADKLVEAPGPNRSDVSQKNLQRDGAKQGSALSPQARFAAAQSASEFRRL